MNIIFLDFDGVLNSQKTIINNIIERRKLSKELIDNRKNKELIIRYRMLDIDSKMLRLVVLLANETNSKVVVTSSWKKLDDYHIIEKELKKMGLPIIGVSLDIRGGPSR